MNTDKLRMVIEFFYSDTESISDEDLTKMYSESNYKTLTPYEIYESLGEQLSIEVTNLFQLLRKI